MKVKDHVDKAKHNQKFVDLLDTEFDSSFYDWRITATFYTAVHYLSAFIAKNKKRVPTSHQETQKLLNPEGDNKLDMEHIPFDAYRELLAYSHKTRYMNHYEGRISKMILKSDLEQSKIDLDVIKEFAEKNGVII